MPDTVYKQPNVFTYSSDYVVDKTFQTLCPGTSDVDTLKDINRDLDTVSINGETVRSIRMKSFTPNELELYSLISTREIQNKEISYLRKFLPEEKKDIPDNQVNSILSAQFKKRNEFQNITEYEQFLKTNLLSEVKDENKKDFLATTLAKNAHQSGFYKAGKAYVGAKMDSLSRAGQGDLFGFRSTIGLEQDASPVLSTNEVCVEQYNKDEGILYYRSRNEKGEENVGAILVGNEKGQLTQEQMDFLTDPARRFEGNTDRPLTSIVSNVQSAEGKAALQKFFNITSARGHTQTADSLNEMLADDMYVSARNANMNTNLTCKDDMVSLKEVINYNGVQAVDRKTRNIQEQSAPEDFATVTSQVHISAITDSANKSGFTMKFESDGLEMVNKAEESYIKKYFDNSFADTSALKQMENILLDALNSSQEGNKPADPKNQEILFKALTQVGLYQKGQLKVNELVGTLESLKALAVKNEKRPSFIKRALTKMDKNKNTPANSLNAVIEKAKGLPEYTQTQKYKAIINKDARRDSMSSRPSLTMGGRGSA